MGIKGSWALTGVIQHPLVVNLMLKIMVVFMMLETHLPKVRGRYKNVMHSDQPASPLHFRFK